MKQSEEIEDLKIVINNLLVEMAVTTIRSTVLANLFFDVVAEQLPQREKEIYTAYVDSVEKTTLEVLSGMEEVLFYQPGFLIRQQINHHELIQSMKRDPRYNTSD